MNDQTVTSTPRTDAAQLIGSFAGTVSVDFARKLERRLWEARKWMQHNKGCASVSTNAPFDTSALPCDCGLDAALVQS